MTGVSAATAGSAAEDRSARRRITIQILLIIAAAFAANFNVLTAGFVWDDRALIINNALIKHWGTLPELFTRPFLGIYYRPLVMVSFALEHALWGMRPFGFHLTNLLLHAANAILVFFIARNVLRKGDAAVLVAILFAVHPVHKGVVVGADRTGILAAFFLLSSAVLYMQSRRAASGPGPTLFYSASLLFYGLGLFSKEVVITLPLALILIDTLVFDEDLKRWPAERILRYALFFSLAAVYLWVRARTLGPTAGFLDAFSIEPARRLLTLPRVLLVYYPLLLLFPFRLDYEPYMPLANSVGEPTVLLSLVLSIAVAASILLLAKKRRAAAFGLLWYLLLFIPTSNIIPIYAGTAHKELFTPIHFLYLPSIGAFILAGAGFDRAFGGGNERTAGRGRRRVVAALFCLVILSWSLLSIARNCIWQNDLRLFEYIVEMHPENHRMRVNLGNVYLERNRADDAIHAIELAVTLAPDVAWYRNSLALAYKAKGWYKRAEEEFHRGLELNPDSGRVYSNLSALYRKQGRLPEAIEAGLSAVELNPGSAQAHSILGLAYKDAGELSRARELFETAIRINPDYAEAYNGLGIVYASEGRNSKARAEWERSLQLRPDYEEARENLQRLQRAGP